MSIKIKDLIKKLKDKDPELEVEFIVVDTKGMMVSMDVETSNMSMIQILELFEGA